MERVKANLTECDGNRRKAMFLLLLLGLLKRFVGIESIDGDKY